MNIPKNVVLADPEFHRPSKVDMLIGTGATLSILSVGQVNLSCDPDLVLQKTLLGWIVGGTAQAQTTQLQCFHTNPNADLSRFWEIEDLPGPKHLSQEERDCETHFRDNIQRDSDGRYVVALPFKDIKDHIGNSKDIAIKRFKALERRFEREPHIKQLYRDVIEEYASLGHMTEVTAERNEGFYLPHHAVVKESSMTTKLRVVFDGSARSSTGISLNEALMVGPTIQDDLCSQLIKFRFHKYVLTGDIEKMYRQIYVRKEDRKFQRILWRNSDNEIATYELNTVTFGLAPAPFLAVRTIHQLTSDEGSEFPLAVNPLKNDLYMDDLLTGSSTIEEMIQIRDQIIQLLNRGGFHMRQFASNSPLILEGLPDTAINLKLYQKDQILKTLGIYWDSQTDTIKYKVQPISLHSKTTKRNIASEIAKIFDPLGLVNPVVVRAKLLMQRLWGLQLDWDESVPLEINSKWTEFASQLPELNNIVFNRFSLRQNSVKVELHGFCDASEAAYGACLYIRSIDDDGKVMTTLLCSKSRVAPLKKPQTIPRLELCAASLLINLYETIKNDIRCTVDQVIFWTDSTIVLHWINTAPNLLKTFVANRVADIQSKSSTKAWRHVRTHDNPADILSRGESAANLCVNDLWKYGPKWLSSDESTWPTINLPLTTEIPDTRRIVCLTTEKSDYTVLERFSSFTKLKRVIAYCLRFQKHNKYKGPLSVEELNIAHDKIILLTQKSTFATELDALQKGKPLAMKSKLLSLSPFIDKNGLIRVGGRIQHSEMSQNYKHPLLLPKSHHVTKMLIRLTHLSNLHSGIQSTLYHLRQKYWVIDGRNQVRYIIYKCTVCSRHNPSPPNYLMGNLPSARVIQSRPFLRTGVDYCGPFFIKEKKFRNKNRIKVYGAVFVCLTTKAVHLEIVSDLTTDGFLFALRRFISRRGRCSDIYSDNGLNFVGANNELKEILKLIQSEEHNTKLQHWLADQQIQWHFNPPYSPHCGGLWEAAVKSLKHHLYRVMGNELLTFEHLNTLFIEIEAVLNSRPLTPLSADPHDLQVLTPGHFLIGDSLTGLPSQDYSNTPVNRLSHFQQVEKIKQLFWRRWHREYLNELNIRHRWTKGEHGLKEGSIVLIMEDNLPPLKWKLGRITRLRPGDDNIVRVADIKTINGTIQRSVKKLSPLPLLSEDSDSYKCDI